jgi:hypothetical protein
MARHCQWLALANASRRIRLESIWARGPTISHTSEAALVAEAEAPLLNHLKHTKKENLQNHPAEAQFLCFCRQHTALQLVAMCPFPAAIWAELFVTHNDWPICFQPLRSIAYRFSISPR